VWPWAPLPVAALYLILLVKQFDGVIAATYMNADSASAPVIGSLAGHGSGAIVLGNLQWYSTLLFELMTRGLPLHRQLWELAPYLMALASVALIVWSLWRVASRWAAMMAAAVLLCASPQLLLLLFSSDDHSPTWFTVALLGAWAVALQLPAMSSRRRTPLLLGGCLVVGVVAGVNAASDQLAVVGGLLPLALSGVAVWMRGTGAPGAGRYPRVPVGAIAALATAAMGGVMAVLTAHAMARHGVSYSAFVSFGDSPRVQANLTLWW
jgi:hypothetical protein